MSDETSGRYYLQDGTNAVAFGSPDRTAFKESVQRLADQLGVEPSNAGVGLIGARGTYAFTDLVNALLDRMDEAAMR